MSSQPVCPLCFLARPITNFHKSKRAPGLQNGTLSPNLPKRQRRLSTSTHSLIMLHSNPDHASTEQDVQLPVRRSKMILTRRIFSWTLGRVRQLDSLVYSNQSGSGLAQKHEPIFSPFFSKPSTEFSVSNELNPVQPVGTYVFRRGMVSIGLKRRSGDPSSRYLQLSYGFVEPHSPGTGNCSNPRATGSLKQWYRKANQWNLLKTDFRKTLVLGQDRRFVNEKKDEGMEVVKPKPLEGEGVPLLVEGQWARVLGHSPRVIVIGDVHGCINEFQQLLRLADYQPGDQVVMLGDLVAKGPDSVGVVQLAKEIGARSVRGNHDYEVVRWWEAHIRGNDSAMVSVEHARIARSLGSEEMAWLLESPWFIECEEMGHLFVHAGFIPNVKLTQQNPRLMMNMRSVLSDGTITAKNVADCEWAKLWKGPQTVVFGHDACRGLQVYEFAKGIDTGCVYGGRLTALILPQNRLISVAAKKAYISPRRFRIVRGDSF